MFRRIFVAAVAAVMLSLAGPASQALADTHEVDAAFQLPALPDVSAPIPVTANSRPFLGAAADWHAAGYVEEEYFLSGMARTYEWDGDDGPVNVIAGPGRYTNRVLVRRPKDPDKFSGNVELSLLNASTMVDRGSPIDFDRLVATGGVWIGVTTKSLTAGTLKVFDPERYAPLDWSNPAPRSERCKVPTIIPAYVYGDMDLSQAPAQMRDPANEDGLVWDMIGQLGMLLKSDQRGRLLPGFGKPRIFVTGISQNALMINTWVVAFHDLYRLKTGEPVFDGYLSIVGANMLRINQCSQDIAARDPRSKAPVLDVPMIKMLSEAEMNLGRYTRRPNVIAGKAGTVTYEVAGAPHARGDIPGYEMKAVGNPSVDDVTRALKNLPSTPLPPFPEGELPNTFPWAPAQRAALHNLERWAIDGVAPPETPGLVLDSTLEIVRDEHGNAYGGLRMPAIDAPVAGYRGAISMEGMGSIIGSMIPFDKETLARLYPTHDVYVHRITGLADAALQRGIVLHDDAEKIKKSAQEAAIP